MKNKLIKGIGKIPLLKPILKKNFSNRYKLYTQELWNDRNNTFIKHGEEALQAFHNCMEDNNFKYTLAFGSILGAIREKGFIKHDMDIDTYMWIEDFNPKVIQKLQESGFKWIKSFSIDNGKYGREDTFQYKGVNVDIFYIYKEINKFPYVCDFIEQKGIKKHERLPRRIELPISKERQLVAFESIKVYIPINAKEICEFRYGPDYMVPNPSWNWVKASQSVIEWAEMIKYTKFTENPNL